MQKREFDDYSRRFTIKNQIVLEEIKMKITRILLSAVLTAAVGLSTLSFAADNKSKEKVKVKIDGAEITFDVEPEIIDGRTMVPLRKIFEELGALVKWDDETQTVSARKSSKTVTLTIDSEDMQIDKGDTDSEGNAIVETVTLDVPAQLVSDRTLVPARAVSEAFGLDVDWDEATNTVSITSEEEDENWKDNESEINLSDMSFVGDGVEIADNQILITKGGIYTLSGTLTDGNITVNTEEKVRLCLNNASIDSTDNPCIYVEKADKVYLMLVDGTENHLTSENAKGVLYSKENLEINGDGALYVTAKTEHGIKASDNITIKGGNINIEAAGDGIHINDTFKMTDGELNIVSVGDGIDSESIVIVEDGKINIVTEGQPIETATLDTTQTTDKNTATQGNRKGMMQETPSLEFESSTKGINAEWMMCLNGGEITVNSSDHAIHCADEIEINGGVFDLTSEYAKGISGHGNVTINGNETVIDIKKSTEGIESKNVLTINDGKIDVVSTDDGLNATGGTSGEMMAPGGQQKPMPQDMQGMTPPDMPEGKTDTQPNPQMQRGERQNNMSTDRNISGKEMRNTVNDANQMVPPSDNNGERRGGMGGFGGGTNKKECLIINGGELEVYAGDDCLDANGNMVLNGGVIKAVKINGTFSGNNGVFDTDGQIVVNEGVTIIAVSGGSQGNMNIPQNTITVYSEASHNDGENIVLYDGNGNIMTEYSPKGNYSAVLITSPYLTIGESYKVALGDTAYDVTLSEQNTTIGTPSSTMGGRNNGFMR